MDAGGAGAEEEEDGREEAPVRVKSPPRFLHGAAARQSRAGPGRAQGARNPRARLEIWGKTSSRHQFIPIIPAGVVSLRAEVGSRRALGSRQDLISAFSGREELQGTLQGWGCQVCACASTWTRDLVHPTHWAFHGILRSLWKTVFLENLREC